jgi:hypothetical protein
MKLERTKIPFDLKFGKLEGINWDRDKPIVLARQLYERQGLERYSVENRIFILFDKSTTSSVLFLRLNELVMMQRLIDAIRTPLWRWLKLRVGEQRVVCTPILIRQGEYRQIEETYQHPLGEGFREEDKASYATQFLIRVSRVSDGLLEVNTNTKEHGLDCWVKLPRRLVEN